jgi:hypothetical protein
VAARRGDQKSDENDRFQSHLVVWREIWEGNFTEAKGSLPRNLDGDRRLSLSQF